MRNILLVGTYLSMSYVLSLRKPFWNAYSRIHVHLIAIFLIWTTFVLK